MKELEQFIQENYEELVEIFDRQKVGVYITDRNATTLLVNSESERVGSVRRQDLVGKSMKHLIELGYIKESVSLKVLQSGQAEDLIQEMGDGSQVYIQGVPIYQNGEICLIVCTERDITEKVRMRTELEYLRKQNMRFTGGIVAEGYAMKGLIEKLLRIAKLDITVLLTGESGTGKETFANLIYENSPRQGAPFIKINCAAIPETLIESELFGYEKGAFTGADKQGKPGIFELADGGTLFLDEIGDLPILTQSRLLRVLEEKELMRIGGQEIIPVDVRIVAATNVDLVKAVEEGRFREDLFYRLNIIPVEIPPLRERREDIRKLIETFIEGFSKKYRIEKKINEDAIALLEEYHWPGNIRELRNMIERLIVSFDGQEITKFQVMGQFPGPNDSWRTTENEEVQGSYKTCMDAFEKDLIQKMLKRSSSLSKAAREMQMDKSTLSRKAKKYGIELK